ncbi:MAG: alkyl sulfatase BDS1-like metallo-beta-lactamase superfamily hydrolase [Paraglaciecola psychrophila]|jgi:alkyl sulfatase BDS1-like metallo-beta-lactamase superfamily hydrolase
MRKYFISGVAATLISVTGATFADEYKPEALKRADPSLHLQRGSQQTEALKVNEAIYQATGFGNTFMVVTEQGNVIIDTSLARTAPRHKELLSAVSDAAIHSVIITHGHGDHTGGVELWKQADTKVIAQQNMVEFLHYQKRLAGMFSRRNQAQFGFAITDNYTAPTVAENYAANILPNTLFDKEMAFVLGGKEFQILHTPAETYDALTVWMPQYKAAFVGDMLFQSFPNIYTLRGTKPRWALDYVASIERIIELQPEILLPSHGQPIQGAKQVLDTLTRYRDAILYVHDQTVIGMNQGKDVHTLMSEIKLPAALDIGEGYGWISWSVRGIYQGYMGWFDGNPVNMYNQSAESIYPDLVKLAGGSDSVLKLAEEKLSSGDPVKSLRLADAALAADSNNREALQLRLQILTAMRKKSSNFNESGWLNAGILETQKQLEQ